MDDAGTVTGIGSFLRGLVDQLLREAGPGWEFVLVQPDRDLVGEPVTWPERLPSGRLRRQRIEPGGVSVTAWLEDWLARERPDVAYFASPDRLACPDTPVPLVATFHDFNFKRFETLPLELRERLRAQLPVWAGRCRLAVVSSRFIASELTSYYPQTAGRTRLIRLGVPAAARPAAPGEWETYRAENGLPERFQLTVGWLAAHKNQALQLQALSLLRRQGVELPLILVGPNAGQLRSSEAARDRYVRELRGLAGELGLRQQRDYWALGNVSAVQLEMLYSRAAAFVTSTLYEAGSFPVREAMRQGCPVVCSDIPALEEDLDQVAGNGLLFDPGDPLDLASALRRVLEQPEAAAERAREARRLVERAFDWRRTARGYLAALATAAGS